MRNRPSLRALFALLLALSLIAAACGGSDDDSTEASSDDSGTTEEPSDDDGGDAASSGLSDEEPEEEEPEEDDPATSEVNDDDSSIFTGADAFCARYAENEALADEFDFFDPDQLEGFVSMSRGLLDEAIGDAPPDLAADLQIIRADFDNFAEVLEAAEYDFFAIAEDDPALTDTAEVEAANGRIDAWITLNCPDIQLDDDEGTSLTDDLTTPDGLDAILGSDVGRELFIDGMTESGEINREQAECMLENLDTDMLSALAVNPDGIDAASAIDLLEVFDQCGISLDAFG